MGVICPLFGVGFEVPYSINDKLVEEFFVPASSEYNDTWSMSQMVYFADGV